MRIINLRAGHPETLWNCQPIGFHDPAVQNLKQTPLITVFVLLKQETDCSTDLLMSTPEGMIEIQTKLNPLVVCFRTLG